MNNKKCVGILFGGRSGEHDVSLVSAYHVINEIDKERFDIKLIGINREGKWKIYDGDIEYIKNGTWENRTEKIRENFSLFDDEELKEIDIFFPVLHGTYGEDGTIQGLFEMMAKPYVGCGVLASSVAMDKEITKILCKDVNIPVTDGITVHYRDIEHSIDTVIRNIEDNFSYPVFIKPANMGSSVGIVKAHNSQELSEGLKQAVLYDTKILIESFIDCMEIEVAVLGNDDPQISCTGQIIPCHEFYDYEAKYMSGDDSLVQIPAEISSELSETIRDYAKNAFRAINGSGLARIDFFIDKTTQEIVLNEINTMPGFTDISMYSKLWRASGIVYRDLITKLIEFGFERFEQRNALITTREKQ